MAAKKKKSKKKKPKPRNVWAINPKSRVQDSKKNYKRSKTKKKERSWVDELFDF